MINFNLQVYPTVLEAAKAQEEVNIIAEQPVGLFFSKPVQNVFYTLGCKYRDSRDSDIMMLISAFDYGYILGKRAERSKKKSTKPSTKT